MKRVQHIISHSLRRTALRCALLAAGMLALSSVASSQDQSVATPKDTIFVRKILMDSINRNMAELEAIASSGKDLDEGKEHADIVSVMLMVFPHLFPPSTNQWKANTERDPGTDTFAAPEVWSNFADFYGRSGAASRLAYKASRTERVEDFKTLVGELRTACDSCHKVYLKSQ
jgi:cytochrome c556